MPEKLLLEIGTEEIPARFLPSAQRQLAQLAAELLDEARIDHGDCTAQTTPRRLVLLVEGVAAQQREMISERKGPGIKVAYDAQGAPTKAGLGFARSVGLEMDQIEERDGYLYARIVDTGRPTLEVLPQIFTDLLAKLHFPKSMRWADYDYRFVRPIQWILALYGTEVVPWEVTGVKSGRESWGHRVLSSGPICVSEPDAYQELLSQAGVMVDATQRRDLILAGAERLAQQVGGVLSLDPDLLEEVTYLVEWPTPFIGQIHEEYLALPPEVLITPMREHQRYFPVTDTTGRLLPYFIGVRNGDDAYLEKVVAGNERVLRARLADARFFYEEDLKESLMEKAAGLERVVFQERLGTMAQKVERIQSLIRWLVPMVGDSSKLDQVERVARLAKADLLTHMVYEFPELQGIMGRYYALSQGEDPQVAQAIAEHYLPTSAGGELPSTDLGRYVAIADKLDTIVGCFAVGLIPTGSQDPYALRRQALGILHILRDAGWDIDLAQAIATAAGSYQAQSIAWTAEKTNEVIDFFLGRLKGVLADEGIQGEIFMAASVQASRPLQVIRRAQVLADSSLSEVFDQAKAAFVRVHNLAKKAQGGPVLEAFFQESSERELALALTQAQSQITGSLATEAYSESLQTLAGLKGALDVFFDGVMVMAEDPKVRENRLNLLKAVEALFLSVADWRHVS